MEFVNVPYQIIWGLLSSNSKTMTGACQKTICENEKIGFVLSEFGPPPKTVWYALVQFTTSRLPS